MVHIPAVDRVDLLLQLAHALIGLGHVLIGHFLAQAGGHFIELVDQPLNSADPFHDIAQHVL